MRQRLEYFATILAIKIARILPPVAIYFIFSTLAKLAFIILKRRKIQAINNLKMALNMSDSVATLTTKKCFLSIARSAAESILIFNDRFDFHKNITNIDEMREFFARFTAQSGGKIIITAHFGNWEALSHFAAILGYPQLVIAREGNNELIEKNIVRPSREKYGNTLAYKHEAMSKMVKTIKNGGLVGILPDLNSGATNSLRASFFGKKCWTTKTIASLALKYGISLAIMGFKRLENGKYECIFKNIDYSGDELAIAQMVNDELEMLIKTAPEQWFWPHNRWREYADRPCDD